MFHCRELIEDLNYYEIAGPLWLLPAHQTSMSLSNSQSFSQHAIEITTIQLYSKVLAGRLSAYDEVVEYIRSTTPPQIIWTMASALHPKFGHYLKNIGELSALEYALKR